MPITTPSASCATLEQTAYRKVTRRLIPFLVLRNVVADLDRVNVGMRRGAAAAAGIAMINAFGNLAGFVSPFMVGSIKDATGSTTAGLDVLAASLVLGGVLVLMGARGAAAAASAGVAPSRA